MNKKIMSLIILPVMLLVGMVLITNVKAAGFNVSRSITGVTNTAVNTFTYSVTADSSNPATVTPPSNTTIAFTSSDTVSSNTITKTASPLIAESVWTGLSYPQPGTYKFIVSESASSNATVYPRDTSTYTVTVYVTNEISGGVPTGNLTKTYIGAQKGGTGTKITSSGNATFTSSAANGMSNMTVSNTLKGSAANTNEYFKYTVSITNNMSGANYAVTGLTSSVTWDGSTVSNPTSCSSSCVIYLKHGQTATIGLSGSLKQLPVGATYSVTQNNTTSQSGTDGYTTTVNGSTGTSSGNKTINATASNNAIAFENTKNDGGVPTSLFIKLFPFLVLLVLSGIGLYTVNKNKKLEASE